jgi:hypothetical protein
MDSWWLGGAKYTRTFGPSTGRQDLGQPPGRHHQRRALQPTAAPAAAGNHLSRTVVERYVADYRKAGERLDGRVVVGPIAHYYETDPVAELIRQLVRALLHLEDRWGIPTDHYDHNVGRDQPPARPGVGWEKPTPVDDQVDGLRFGGRTGLDQRTHRRLGVCTQGSPGPHEHFEAAG